MPRQARRLMRQGVADLLTRAHVDAYTGPNGEVISDGDTLRLQDGATPGGVSLVSLRSRILSSFTGAAPRLLADLLFAQCHAVIWGVTTNTGTDQGPALRKATAWAQSRGADLILPEGEMMVGPDAADSEAVLRITRLMGIKGAGRGSVLLPMASVGTRTIILIKPAANAGGIRGMVLRDFSIGYLADRLGGDGICFDTSNLNGFIAKPLVDNVGIANAGVGYVSIRHRNNPDPATGNLNGGLFGGTFLNSDFFGGMKFEKTGDSNNIVHNVITGPNAGIEYEAINGAATHLIHGNNITAWGGSIILRNTIQAKITCNQTESFHAYTGSLNAQIVLDNCHDCEVEENNCNAYDRVDVFRLSNSSSGNTIANNTVIYSSAAGKVMVRLVGSPNNTIGRQRSENDCTRTTNGPGEDDDTLSFVPRGRTVNAIDAGSYPTLGAFQPLTLDASWLPGSDPAFYQGLSVSLKPDGDVIFRGTIASSATQNPGAPVTTLPPAYRPAKAIRIGADMLIPGSPNTWGRAIFIVDETGGVFVQSTPNTTLIQFDGTTYSRL